MPGLRRGEEGGPGGGPGRGREQGVGGAGPQSLPRPLALRLYGAHARHARVVGGQGNMKTDSRSCLGTSVILDNTSSLVFTCKLVPVQPGVTKEGERGKRVSGWIAESLISRITTQHNQDV